MVASTDPDPSGVRVQPRRRVLVIDDEVLVAGALKRALEHHDVTVAKCGADALEVIATAEPFDVVLCDVMMPGMSGPRVYELVVASRPELRSRFVFITGGVLVDTTRRFLASVPNRVVYKPFEVTALRDLVREISDIAA